MTKENMLEVRYLQQKNLYDAYDAALERDDQKTATEIWGKVDELQSMWRKDETPYQYALWEMYEEARDNGNTMLDINEPMSEAFLMEAISTMRQNGIERFTVSSERQALFMVSSLVRNGCVIEGVTKIKEYEFDVPALAFRIAVES